MAPQSGLTRRSPFGGNPAVGERGASTQRRILDVGLEVFAERGYHDTGVELIADAAGCSRPAFYQYFSGKQDLFWHLASQLAREMGELAERIDPVTPDEEGLASVRRWLDAFIDLCGRYDPVLAGYQAAAREGRPELRDTRAIGNRVGAALVRAAGPGHPELDRPALTNTIVAVVMRSVDYWRLGVGQLGRRRFVDGLARTIHRVLHGAVDGVNVTRATKAPPRRAPSWPEFPGSSDHPVTLRARGQRTRQALLDAGSRVLPEHGYHATRVDDIVEAAGVSHGSFYRYFSNKDELFHALAEQAARTMVEHVATFPDDLEPTAIREWLDSWFAAYRGNGGVISAWQEINYDDEELRDFSLDIALVAFDRLRRIVHRRGFGDDAVDAVVLLAVVERMPYSVLALRHIEEPEAVGASTFIVHRGLFGRDG
jgi:AcrR family transcriptional regulator